MASPPLILCIGNPARTDDGVGPAVAQQLREAHPELAITECGGEAIELLDLWSEAERAIVVDAVLTGAQPGTIHLLDVNVHELPLSSRTSSHGVGLAEAVELGRALGRLPGRLTVVGVEASDLGPGMELTPAVAEAVPAAAGWVLRELSHA